MPFQQKQQAPPRPTELDFAQELAISSIDLRAVALENCLRQGNSSPDMLECIKQLRQIVSQAKSIVAGQSPA